MFTHLHTSQLDVLCPEINCKHMCDTHFQGITDNIYGFEDLFLLLIFVTSLSIFVPVHKMFSPSRGLVDGSLHKAMPVTKNYVQFRFL